MSDKPARGTGNDDLSGVDPGGTRPTKPGNPDKEGGARSGATHAGQTVDGRKNADANDI